MSGAWLTACEAAELLELSTAGVRSAIRRGKLETLPSSGAAVKISHAAVKRYRNAHSRDRKHLTISHTLWELPTANDSRTLLGEAEFPVKDGAGSTRTLHAWAYRLHPDAHEQALVILREHEDELSSVVALSHVDSAVAALAPFFPGCASASDYSWVFSAGPTFRLPVAIESGNSYPSRVLAPATSLMGDEDIERVIGGEAAEW